MNDKMDVIVWSMRKGESPATQEIRILLIDGFLLSSKSGKASAGQYRVISYSTAVRANVAAVRMTEQMEEHYGYTLYHEPRHVQILSSNHGILTSLDGSSGALPWADSLFKKAIHRGVSLASVT